MLKPDKINHDTKKEYTLKSTREKKLGMKQDRKLEILIEKKENITGMAEKIVTKI